MKRPNKLDWLIYRIFKWWWNDILLNNHELWRKYVKDVNRFWRAGPEEKGEGGNDAKS